MYELAPGNVLQNMYLTRRLKQWVKPGMRFIELGPGNGIISRLMLKLGMHGTGVDLNNDACAINRERNADFITSGQYTILNEDFFSVDVEPVDLVIASHVIEHMPDEMLEQYFARCQDLLVPGGKIISLVPANMNYWCVEDETAGHYRRFERDDFRRLAESNGYTMKDMSGLTYPLSNWLFPLANRLVERSDGWKRGLTPEEQTLVSSTGVKQIHFKTVYPDYFRYLINAFTMYPFHLMQLAARNHPKCLILYCEMVRPA